MGPLAWIEAAGWSALASVGLIIGALAGLFSPLEHRGIARIMAAGAGVLLATASLDLTIASLDRAGALHTPLFLTLGAGFDPPRQRARDCDRNDP
jgi:hypothetical protein